MTSLPKKPLLPIEIISAAPEQEPILTNLLELYAHDFSEFAAVEMGADGHFGYARLPLSWTEPKRHPLLMANGQVSFW